MTLPFLAVHVGNDGTRTHLALHSPTVPGHSPDQIPPTALYGAPTTSEAASAPADVECRPCLHQAPANTALPAFGVPA